MNAAAPAGQTRLRTCANWTAPEPEVAPATNMAAAPSRMSYDAGQAYC
jgi:hypothetical protein